MNKKLLVWIRNHSLLKLIRSFCLTALARTTGIIAVMSVLVIVVTYIWIQAKSEKVLIDKTLAHEQIVARAGSLALSNFFQNLSYSLINQQNLLRHKEISRETVLDNFMQNWQNTPVSGIILIDRTGRVVAGKNRNNISVLGADVSDRDFFVWAKQAHERQLNIGRKRVSRFGASEGRIIVTLTVPVIDSGEFQGALTTAVLLEDLARYYVAPLQFSQETKVHLLDSQGDVLFSSRYPRVLGENVFSFLYAGVFPESAKIGTKLAGSMADLEGGAFVFPSLKTRNGKEEERLLAVSPVTVNFLTGGGTKSWFLILDYPKKDAMVYFGLFTLVHTAMLVVSLTVVLVFSMSLILAVRLNRKKSFQTGFHSGLRHNSR